MWKLNGCRECVVVRWVWRGVGEGKEREGCGVDLLMGLGRDDMNNKHRSICGEDRLWSRSEGGLGG